MIVQKFCLASGHIRTGPPIKNCFLAHRDRGSFSTWASVTNPILTRRDFVYLNISQRLSDVPFYHGFYCCLQDYPALGMEIFLYPYQPVRSEWSNSYTYCLDSCLLLNVLLINFINLLSQNTVYQLLFIKFLYSIFRHFIYYANLCSIKINTQSVDG